MIRLIADIGGTNARFALAEPGGAPDDERHLLVRDHAGLGEAALVYLAGRRVEEAVIAVATPVESETIRFTNSPWTLHPREPARPSSGSSRLHVINDFAAQALAMPHLAAEELEPIGGGSAEPGRAAAVLGPGTGLGVSALIPGRPAGRRCPARAATPRSRPATPASARSSPNSRGASSTSRTSACSRATACSTSRKALARLDGTGCAATTPEAVTDAARDGTCPACVEAAAIFSAVLGAVAGDLALTLGARGGVFIAGGVCLRLGVLVRPRRVPPALCRQGPDAALSRGYPGLAGAPPRHRPDRRGALPCVVLGCGAAFALTARGRAGHEPFCGGNAAAVSLGCRGLSKTLEEVSQRCLFRSMLTACATSTPISNSSSTRKCTGPCPIRRR